jgi:hypothetical protein
MSAKRSLIVAVLLLDIIFCLVPLLRAEHVGERLQRIVSAVRLVATLTRE